MSTQSFATKDWTKDLEVWGRPLADAEIYPENVGLLVVDMQNYGCKSDMGLGKIICETQPTIEDYYYPRVSEMVIPNNQRLIEHFRAWGREVVFVTVGPELGDGRDLIPRRSRRITSTRQDTGVDVTIARGSNEHDIVPELKPLPNELVVNKNTSGAFNSSALDQLMRNLGLRTLVITGVSTNTCVETTARDASDRGYECILVEDACATFDHESHNATLRIFKRMFGDVLTTDEVISRLEPLMI